MAAAAAISAPTPTSSSAAIEDISSEQLRTLWVGGISDRVDEETLYELFINAGPLETVRIPVDKETKRQKPYAFIVFSHADSLPFAYELFRDVKLYGRSMRMQNKETGLGMGNGHQGGRHQHQHHHHQQREPQTPPQQQVGMNQRSFSAPGHFGQQQPFHGMAGINPYLMGQPGMVQMAQAHMAAAQMQAFGAMQQQQQFGGHQQRDGNSSRSSGGRHVDRDRGDRRDHRRDYQQRDRQGSDRDRSFDGGRDGGYRGGGGRNNRDWNDGGGWDSRNRHRR